MEEDICSPGSPVLCSGVRGETSLLVGVILLEKLLGSFVAQTLVMMICEAVSLLRILGCKKVVKLGKCKKMTAGPLHLVQHPIRDRKNIVKLLCLLE